MNGPHSVFDVWKIRDINEKGHPHYPRFNVYEIKIGSASSLVSAESIISESVTEKENAHCYYIREIPVDRKCSGDEYLSCFVYDFRGKRVDERLYSTMSPSWSFAGRTPEQIRFSVGELVEYHKWDTIGLGLVVDLPPDIEKAKKSISKGAHLDVADDNYIILTDSDADSTDYVDSLHVFKPRFKINPATEKRLRKAYRDYITLPKRLEIANATARVRFNDIFDEFGISGRIDICPAYEHGYFILHLELPSGSADLIIDGKKMYDHPERVRVTIGRLAGKKPEGRGYIPKEDKYHSLSI